jgi:hypothetical protein
MKLLNYENINNKLLTPINFIRKKKFTFILWFQKIIINLWKALKIFDCSQIYENWHFENQIVNKKLNLILKSFVKTISNGYP